MSGHVDFDLRSRDFCQEIAARIFSPGKFACLSAHLLPLPREQFVGHVLKQVVETHAHSLLKIHHAKPPLDTNGKHQTESKHSKRT